MVRLCQKYKFKKDTLFLAICILDKVIQANLVHLLEDHELMGGVLIVLTTKYNEVYPVTIDKINDVIQSYYPRFTFFDVEGQVLECLDF